MPSFPLLLAALALSGAQGNGAPEAPLLQAVRVGQPPRLDGALDDAAWQTAPSAVGFRQREPREGEAASEETEVRVVYDDNALYVGILARDREPEAVIGRILERDRLIVTAGDGDPRFAGDDAVAFTLDPFHDHRNAFVFATNPNGAEYDALVTDERTTLNVDWRSVWRVAARRVPVGWSAEFAIPFRSLRYPDADGDQVWGFDVARTIRRRNEDTLWSAFSRAEGGLNRVSRAGHLLGLRGLPRSRANVEVRPFGLVGATRQPGPGGEGNDGTARAGADLKWEASPGVVLDATLRPDFAQIEADDETVNLTRFELFLPEKRDFFLENAGVFDFGTRGSFETPPFLLFFSRRIGIFGDTEAPVLGGLRLSGRAGRQTIGLLDVLTGDAPGADRTNFALARVKRDVGERSHVGAMLTDRRADSGSRTDLGLDASLWPTSRLNLQGFAAHTTRSDGAPDWALRGAAAYQGDPLYLFGEYLRIGQGAETAMGFVTQTDVRRASGKAQFTLRPHLPVLRSLAVFAGGKKQTRVDGRPRDENAFAGVSFDLHSGDGLSVTHVRGSIDLDWGFDLAGQIPVQPGHYRLADTVATLYTSASRPLGAVLNRSRQALWDGSIDALTASLTLKGGSHLSLSASVTRSAVDLPSGAFVAHVTGLRVGWAFSTRLVAHAYAQYNSLDRRVVGNLRLRFLHRPGSDLHLVFNEERVDAPAKGVLLARGFAVKLSYLWRL
jgi:hypothetical protein